MNRRKQRQAEAKQAERNTQKAQARKTLPPGAVAVNEAALAPNNSYGAPDFVMRGYYLDQPFKCTNCGKEEVWKASQQKWWYEVAKGFAYSTAKLCHACRRKEQARKAEARRVHQEGLARKKATKR